jgi:hypothetical protein
MLIRYRMRERSGGVEPEQRVPAVQPTL